MKITIENFGFGKGETVVRSDYDTVDDCPCVTIDLTEDTYSFSVCEATEIAYAILAVVAVADI